MFIRKIIGRGFLAGVLGFGFAAVGTTGSTATAEESGYPAAGLRVPAKGSDSHQVTLRKGVRVNIKAFGDGDTDIDLYVYDPNGRLVGKDDDTTDKCIVEFTPEETGTYQLKITNLGNVYNEYTLQIK